MSRLFSARALSSFLICLLLASVMIVATHPAYASTAATLTEWTVPTGGSVPYSLALDPSGSCCWFVEQVGNKVAHLDTSTNTFQEWPIPTPGATPYGLAVTSFAGSTVVVGTEYATNKVFVFFPNNGTFKEYTLQTPNSGPLYVSIEPGGEYIRAWFTEWITGSMGEIIYNPSNGAATFYNWTIPAGVGGRAGGVYAGSGIIWFAGLSGLVKWDRAASQFTTWPIPAHPSTYGAFAHVDSLGQIWYTSRNATTTDNYVGVLRGDNTFKEWQIPSVGADVRVISISPLTQNPWVAEQGTHKIARLDPSSGGVVTGPVVPAVSAFAPVLGTVTTVTNTALPSTAVVSPTSSANTGTTTGQFTEWALAGGSSPHDVVVDASGNAWILESAANKVARLTLTTPDFGLSVNPATVSVVQGASTSTTTNVTSVASFSSAVTLSTSGAPAGLTITFVTNPVTPPAGSFATSATSIAADAALAVGTYSVTVTGTSGALTHSTALSVQVTSAVVPDFSIACAPAAINAAQGGSGTSTCTVTSINGFSAAVDLAGAWVGSAPTDVSHTLPTPVTPPAGGTVTSTLTITAGASASTGPFTFRVTATSGALTHTADVVVVITAGVADFSISVAPSSMSLSPGGSGAATVTVQSLGLFSSAVTLSQSGGPSGLTLIFGTNPVTPPAGGAASSILTVTVAGAPTGTYTITITGTSGALIRNTALTVQIAGGGGGCLIATATYDSEVSDEVQFLRNFRDRSILKTSAGSSFMVAFNAWYYSFSPYVAQFIREHSTVKTGMRFLLYPLLGILQVGAAVFSLFPSSSEVGAIAAGLVVSSLIGLVYAAVPLTILATYSSRVRRLAIRFRVPALAILLGATLIVCFATLAGVSGVLMMIVTSAIVLSSLASSALIASTTIVRLARLA